MPTASRRKAASHPLALCGPPARSSARPVPQEPKAERPKPTVKCSASVAPRKPGVADALVPAVNAPESAGTARSSAGRQPPWRSARCRPARTPCASPRRRPRPALPGTKSPRRRRSSRCRANRARGVGHRQPVRQRLEPRHVGAGKTEARDRPDERARPALEPGLRGAPFSWEASLSDPVHRRRRHPRGIGVGGGHLDRRPVRRLRTGCPDRQAEQAAEHRQRQRHGIDQSTMLEWTNRHSRDS